MELVATTLIVLLAPIQTDPQTTTGTSTVTERDSQTETETGPAIAVESAVIKTAGLIGIGRQISRVNETERPSENVVMTETGVQPENRTERGRGIIQRGTETRTESRPRRDTETRRTNRITGSTVDDVMSHVIEAKIPRYSASSSSSFVTFLYYILYYCVLIF